MSHKYIQEIEGRELPEFNRMQTVKRRFFAMRNGALAEQMRRGGLNYRINFGLNVPQIKEIAQETVQAIPSEHERMELAVALWQNDTTRESRLMAPMIMPTTLVSAEQAYQMLLEAQTTEVADMLCHSLLRHLSGAEDMAYTVISNSDASDINRYTALRLLLNLLMQNRAQPERLSPVADDELQRQCALTRGVTRQIIEEIEFLLEDEDN